VVYIPAWLHSFMTTRVWSGNPSYLGIFKNLLQEKRYQISKKKKNKWRNYGARKAVSDVNQKKNYTPSSNLTDLHFVALTV